MRFQSQWKDIDVLCFSFGLGKTELAEALATKVCSRGYWFVDDPDDFRELDGHLESGDVIVVDEVTLAGLPVNDVKKLFDVEKNRRVRCRHFNGSIPKHLSRLPKVALCKIQSTDHCKI